MMFFELLLLLFTAIGLSPGGNSPTLVQTKIKIHKTTIKQKTTKHKKNIKQHNNYKTIKISTQTEHSKCITKTHTHTHTYFKTYEIKTNYSRHLIK
jgi:hypothetical protein